MTLTLPDGTTAAFHTEDGAPPPERILPADDRTRAADAVRLLRDGTALLWTGDYHNGRQLLAAVRRRIRAPRPKGRELSALWRADRIHTSTVAEVTGRILVRLDADGSLPLRRAPDTTEAITWALGALDRPVVLPLRTVVGALGAAGWTRKGLAVPGLQGTLIPRFGVFSPTRNAYVGLLDHLDFTDRSVLDAGCGTGVLGFIALQRGATRVYATDIEPRAVACARLNAARLGLAEHFQAAEADLFWPDPQVRVDLALLNPPWMPEAPRTRLDRAVFDDTDLIGRWLADLSTRLTPGGRGALLLSDLPTRLGLRAPDALMGQIVDAGLVVADRHDAPVSHRSVKDPTDPLQVARGMERVQLWVLAPKDNAARTPTTR